MTILLNISIKSFVKFSIHLLQRMHICQIPHVIFESTSHFSFKFYISLQCHQTQLPCTFLDQTLYTMVKGANFRVFESKFVKFFMSVLKWHVNYPSSNFALLFIVMTHNSSVNLKLVHFLLWIKDPIKVPVLTLSGALVKICQISQVFFQTKSHFFFKICITLQCHER